MPKIDLLPCPFCGSSRVKFYRVTGMYEAACSDCRCTSGIEGTKEAATAAWNTRASGWIPVWVSRKEAMPKKDGEYLCVSNGELKILPYRNGEFYCTCFDAVLRCCNSSVTHWIPLPEPPKEMNNVD